MVVGQGEGPVVVDWGDLVGDSARHVMGGVTLRHEFHICTLHHYLLNEIDFYRQRWQLFNGIPNGDPRGGKKSCE